MDKEMDKEMDKKLTPAQLKKKAYYEKNKAAIRAKQKAHYDKKKDIICEKKKEYYKQNCERIKKRVAIQQKDYYQKPEVKEHKQAYRKKYNSRDSVKKYRALRHVKKYATDIDYKMTTILRGRLSTLVNSKFKYKSTKKLLGCSMEHFKEWIEFQFDDNMNWNNHGDYWHLDHIKPCAKFKMSKKEDQEECFHWTNLQPLEATENLEKSDKYTNETKTNAKLMLMLFNMGKKIDNTIKDITSTV